MSKRITYRELIVAAYQFQKKIKNIKDFSEYKNNMKKLANLLNVEITEMYKIPKNSGFAEDNTYLTNHFYIYSSVRGCIHELNEKEINIPFEEFLKSNYIFLFKFLSNNLLLIPNSEFENYQDIKYCKVKIFHENKDLNNYEIDFSRLLNKSLSPETKDCFKKLYIEIYYLDNNNTLYEIKFKTLKYKNLIQKFKKEYGTDTYYQLKIQITNIRFNQSWFKGERGKCNTWFIIKNKLNPYIECHSEMWGKRIYYERHHNVEFYFHSEDALARPFWNDIKKMYPIQSKYPTEKKIFNIIKRELSWVFVHYGWEISDQKAQELTNKIIKLINRTRKKRLNLSLTTEEQKKAIIDGILDKHTDNLYS